jgi:uncharacterized protein (UPF0248 family)
MRPIRELLNRIRWDKEFGKGNFEIGYDDHIEQKILRVPFRKITIREGDFFSFEAEDAQGVVRTIPFHRVREIHRDGHLIWRRPPSL